jgi:hypothetical protein
MKKQSMLILTCCLVALGMFSCRSLVLRSRGLKDPKPETVESVTAALTAYQQWYKDYLCVFKDSAALADLFGKRGYLAASQFYDRNGYRIITNDSGFCLGVEARFAGNLNPQGEYPVDSSYRITEMMKYLKVIGDSVSAGTGADDFSVVLVWAKYLEPVNPYLFAMADTIHRHHPMRINFIFFNIDEMKDWNLKEPLVKFRN